MATKKPSRASSRKPALNGIKVKEYIWGAIFTGTPRSLIEAKLMAKAHVPPKTPRKAKDVTRTYRLPLNWSDGYNAACYGPGGPIPPCWDARAEWSWDNEKLIEVSVYYNERDRDVQARAGAALRDAQQHDPAFAKRLRATLKFILPQPLYESVPAHIEAAADFMTDQELRHYMDERRRARAGLPVDELRKLRRAEARHG